MYKSLYFFSPLKCIRHIVFKLFFTFLFLFVSLPFLYGQSSIEKRLVKAIAENNLTETSRILDSSSYNVRKVTFNNLSLFHYSLFADSLPIFRLLMNRAGTMKASDLFVAAGIGHNSQVFLAILEKFYSTNLDNYIDALDILSPLSDSARGLMKMILSEPFDDLYDLEDKLEDVDELPKAITDTNALKILIKRMEMVGNKTEVAALLADEAIDSKWHDNTLGSIYLTNNYVYNNPDFFSKCYQSGYFKSAFQRGKWNLVDFFIQNGIKPNLKDINLSSVKDPERAIGYYVKSQLIERANNFKALVANRTWKMPQVNILLPKGNGSTDNTILIPEYSPGYLFVNGPNVLNIDAKSLGYGITGQFPAGSTNGSLCILDMIVNDKKSQQFSGSCVEGFKINIPAIDTISGGEYCSLIIDNTGYYGISFRINPANIIVYRNGSVLDTVSVGKIRTFNRAFGPIELRVPLSSPGTIGFTAELFHRSHAVKVETDFKTRLELYKTLTELIDRGENISEGSAYTFDNRTTIRLISDQLHESAPQVVKGELRIAMATLAEQSEFTAKFTNVLYTELLGAEVPDALEPFLLSQDSLVRQQARTLKNALNRRSASLGLLEEENIRTYASRILRVQNLLYELSQYYSKEDLLFQLNTILNDLTTSNRQKFMRNIKQSIDILKVVDTDVDGKGTTIKKFLQL